MLEEEELELERRARKVTLGTLDEKELELEKRAR